MVRHMRKRNAFAMCMLIGYLAFGLACILDSDSENNTGNNTSNNSKNNSTPTTLGGNVENEQVWKGKLEVTKDVFVREGASVTIEAGTEIVMCADCSIHFGYLSDRATVKANGTAEKPIIIRGKDGDAGYWASAIFGANLTSNSAIKHVQIKHAGQTDAPAALFESAILVEDLTVEDSGEVGVYAAGFKEGSKNLTVSRTAGYPVVLASEDALHNFPTGDTLTEGGKPYVKLDFSDLKNDSTMRKLSLPYFMAKDMRIRDSGTLTVDAGVNIVVDTDLSFALSYLSDVATFKFNGTETEPIVFQGADPQAGSWAGLSVGNKATSNSYLEHVFVRHAGGIDNYAFDANSDVVLKNVTFEDNKKGVFLNGVSFGEGSTALTIKGTKEAPLTIPANAMVTIPDNSDFSGNDDDHVLIDSPRMETSGTIPKINVPYLSQRGVFLANSVDVTFSAGVTIKFAADTTLYLSYLSDVATFTIAGTAEDPVTFTGADETAGSWDGAIVGNKASSSSIIKHAKFLYGGKSDGANLSTDIPLEINNSSFENSSGYGLIINYRDAEDPPRSYDNTNTFSGNAQGNVRDDRQ